VTILPDETFLLINLGVWVACALAAAGLFNAFLQEEFHDLGAKDQRQNFGIAILFGLMGGPISLFVAFFMTGFCQYGWTLSTWDAGEHEGDAP